MSSVNTSSLPSTLLVLQQQITRYLYSVYLIFGITGCCLNILLFSRPKFRTVSCCTYFLASSVAMIFNLGMGIGSSLYAINHVDPNTTILAFCKLRIYLNQVVALTYRWSLTTACFDRYALSSTNARLRNIARVYIARRAVGVIVIVWFILPVHTLIFYNLRNGACGILYSTAAALYHSLFTTMVSCILPTSIMFSCALLIRRSLALKRQRRHITVNPQGQGRDDAEHLNRIRDQQVLIMLFTQVIVYVISVIPLMVIYIYTAVTFQITNKPIERIAIEKFTAFVGEAMIYVFPASSFYLYTMSSNTFRNELIRLLRSAVHYRSVNNVQPITTVSALKTAGKQSAAVQISQSHIPGLVPGRVPETDEQQGNINRAKMF